MSSGLQSEIRQYYEKVSRFLDREHRDAPDEPFWADLARERARETGRGAGLDLGCGTGRVTVHLAEALDWVVGLDLSPVMLARAAARSEERGARFHCLAADMRRFHLRRRFALIAAANDPFAHLTGSGDRDRALARVAEHLEPEGGRFVLDAHWFPPARLAAALEPGGLVEEHAGEGIDVRETWRCEADGACHARYEYLRGGEALEEARFESRHWTASELEERFARAGLAVDALWGDYQRTPWRKETATHLIAVGRRR